MCRIFPLVNQILRNFILKLFIQICFAYRFSTAIVYSLQRIYHAFSSTIISNNGYGKIFRSTLEPFFFLCSFAVFTCIRTSVPCSIILIFPVLAWIAPPRCPTVPEGAFSLNKDLGDLLSIHACYIAVTRTIDARISRISSGLVKKSDAPSRIASTTLFVS